MQKLWNEQLRYLFDYAQVCDDAGEWFNEDETDRIMRAISELKILDPAVGSGAFPMERIAQTDPRTATAGPG